MKVTREQLKKWQAGLADGWKLDAQRLIVWGEKNAYIDSPTDENGAFYRIDLVYIDSNSRAIARDGKSGAQIPNAMLNRYTPAGVGGLFRIVKVFAEQVGEPQSKRNFAYLQKLTHEIDTAALFKKAIEQDTGKTYNDLSDFFTSAEDEPESGEEAPEEEPAQEEQDKAARIINADGRHETARAAWGDGWDYWETPATDEHDRPTVCGMSGAELVKIAAAIEAEKAARADIEEAAAEVYGMSTEDFIAESEAEQTEKAAESDAEAAETITDEETPAEEETNAIEGKNGAKTASVDRFAELARAWYTGKSAPKQTEAPADNKPEDPADNEPEEDAAPEEETPEEIGYNTPSDELTPEEVATLDNGGQVEHDAARYSFGKDMLFTTPQSEKVRLVYRLKMYNAEQIPAGNDAEFFGVIVNGAFYRSEASIIEKMTRDINRRLIELVPDETTAARTAANVDEWERKQIDNWKNLNWTGEAKTAFFDSKPPRLVLYDKSTQDWQNTIEYLLDAPATVEKLALAYMCDHAAEIYKRYIRHNKTKAIYDAISADKGNDEHKLLRIRNSISDQKTVKIELANGHEVKVEADAVKYITSTGYISDYRVAACDRQYLRKDERGRAEDIILSDIVAIRHGGKVLYGAA